MNACSFYSCINACKINSSKWIVIIQQLDVRKVIRPFTGIDDGNVTVASDMIQQIPISQQAYCTQENNAAIITDYSEQSLTARG